MDCNTGRLLMSSSGLCMHTHTHSLTAHALVHTHAHTHTCAAHTHVCTHTHTERTNRSSHKQLKTLLPAAGMYASAPAPLADREGGGTSAEESTFLWNTVLPFSPQSGRFLTAKESWKKEEPTWATLIFLWASKLPTPYLEWAASYGCVGNTSFSYVWWLAGLLVTLQTRYFRLIVPQWVTSTFRPVPNKKNEGYRNFRKIFTQVVHYYKKKSQFWAGRKICVTSNVILGRFKYDIANNRSNNDWSFNANYFSFLLSILNLFIFLHLLIFLSNSGY